MTQKQKQRNKIFAFPRHFCPNRNFTMNWRLVNRSIFGIIIILVIAYIISVNDLSIQSFTLSQTKNKINEIQKEGEKLDLTAMNLGSFDTINQRAQDMKMVKVDKIDYIEIVNGSVAKK